MSIKSPIPRGGLYYNIQGRREEPHTIPDPVIPDIIIDEEDLPDMFAPEESDPPETLDDLQEPEVDDNSDNDIDIQPMDPSRLGEEDVHRIFPELSGVNAVMTVLEMEVRSPLRQFGPPPQHSTATPPQPEPLHQYDSHTLAYDMMMADLDSILSNNTGRVVYDSSDCKMQGGTDSLSFTSNWESGNLRKVIQMSCLEYHIITAVDVNCESHTQV